jgi:hypothetical protein
MHFTLIHLFVSDSSLYLPVGTGNFQLVVINFSYADGKAVRERPFNLKGEELWFFSKKKYSDSQCC